MAVVILAVGLSWFGTHRILPYGTGNNDEPVYVHTARVMAGGQLTQPASEVPDGLRPWLNGTHDDNAFAAFPPGWPAVMAITVRAFDSPEVAVALVAGLLALGGYLLGRELGGNARTGALTALALVVSPFFVIHSATRLSYLGALAVEVLAGWLAVSARHRGRPVRLVGAGALLGVLFATRPFDSVLIALCLLIYLCLAPPPRGDRLPVVSTLGRTALGAAGPLTLTLTYNARVTGSPLEFPLSAAGGDNRFGFGLRHIVDGSPVVDVTPHMAFGALRLNLGELPHWLFGGLLVLPVIIGGAIVLARRDRAAATWLAAITVLVPVAFFFYWGNLLIVNGRNDLGPHYYLALLIPAAAATGIAVDALARWRGLAAVGVVVALAATTVVADLPGPLERAERTTAAARTDLDVVAAARTEAGGPLLIVLPSGPDGPWIMHPRGHLDNAPGPPGDVLYAAFRGNADLDLFDRYPDRAIYQLGDVRDGVGTPVRPVVRRLQRHAAAVLDLDTAITPPSDASAVDVTVAGPGGGWRCHLPPGEARLRWRLRAGTTEPLSCPTTPEPVPAGDVSVVVEVHRPDRTAVLHQRLPTAVDGDRLTVAAPGWTWRTGDGDNGRLDASTPELTVTVAG